MEDSSASDDSLINDNKNLESTEDMLDDYMRPSFWLFIEQEKTSPESEVFRVKFYLYCG